MRRCGTSNTDTRGDLASITAELAEIKTKLSETATREEMMKRMTAIQAAVVDLDKKITRHRGSKYTLPFVISSLTCIIGMTSPIISVIVAGVASAYLLLVAYVGDGLVPDGLK